MMVQNTKKVLHHHYINKDTNITVVGISKV